jgi:hypothetical protein
MKRVLIGGALIIVVLALSYAVFAWQKVEAPIAPVPSTSEVSQVSLSNSFEEGFHTISGEIIVDDACRTLTTEAITEGNTIRVDITVSEDEDICLERKTLHTFTVEIEAPESAPINVFVNGVVAAILTNND